METTELEIEVYDAFIKDAELMDALPLREKAIFHYVAPSVEPKRYPIIVYSPISDVPAMHGDNREVAHRVTIRIHVIAAQKRFDVDKNNFIRACRRIKAIMTELGFMRRQTTPYVEDGKVMRIFDFVTGVESCG